jgi:FkbM family methyltransferase
MHSRELKFRAFGAVKRTLDRPGFRPLLGLLTGARRGANSALVSAHIWRERRVWVPLRATAHRDRDREELARDLFFQEYTPQPGDTVVDVGAGAGEEVELFSRLVGPGGRVYAVEAHPATFAALEARCARAGLDNVVAVHAAASDRAGTVSFSDDESYLENRITDGKGALVVPAMTLDELLDGWAVERIDFLKMNIEGAEEAALRGLAGSAPRVRHLAVSCHDFLADRGGDPANRTRAAVERVLAGYGFRVTVRRRSDRRHWTRPYLYGTRSSTST